MNMNTRAALLTVALLAPAFMNASQEPTVRQSYLDNNALSVESVFRNSVTGDLVMVDAEGNQTRLVARPATPVISAIVENVTKLEEVKTESMLKKWTPNFDKKNLFRLTTVVGVAAIAAPYVVPGCPKELKKAQLPVVLATLASGYAAYVTPSSSAKSLAPAVEVAAAVEEKKAE